MSKPLAICIEDLDAPATPSQYTRCVALPGRQPGLRLDKAGRILWHRDEAVACELWVSADDRLILYRPEDAPPVVVLRRTGRSLDVPCSKPVVLLDQDRVDIGARHLRIHVHGEAPTVAAPTPLLPAPPPTSRARGHLAQSAATAALVGALAVGCIEVRLTPPVPEEPTATPTVEVRDYPPEPVVPTDTPTPTIEVRDFPPTATAPSIPESSKIVNVIQGHWTVAQAYDVEGEQVWITGTLTIEESTYSFAPTREIIGMASPGMLDYLFTTPTGEVSLTYNIDSQAAIENVTPDYTVAFCSFGVNATRFEIRVGDSGHLRFVDPSRPDQVDLWHITK